MGRVAGQGIRPPLVKSCTPDVLARDAEQRLFGFWLIMPYGLSIKDFLDLCIWLAQGWQEFVPGGVCVK